MGLRNSRDIKYQAPLSSRVQKKGGAWGRGYEACTNTVYQVHMCPGERGLLFPHIRKRPGHIRSHSSIAAVLGSKGHKSGTSWARMLLSKYISGGGRKLNYLLHDSPDSFSGCILIVVWIFWKQLHHSWTAIWTFRIHICKSTASINWKAKHVTL